MEIDQGQTKVYDMQKKKTHLKQWAIKVKTA